MFELARMMGTSVEMIERHYGTLLDGSGASMASRLAVVRAEQDRAADRARTEAGQAFGPLLGHALDGRPLESPTART